MPSFISLYSYDLEKETPLLSIKTKQENMFTIMENKSDCTDNFTLIELANFFDLDYWLLLKSNLDGGSQSILINKINGTDCYLGYSGYMKENIMNDLIFFQIITLLFLIIMVVMKCMVVILVLVYLK